MLPQFTSPAPIDINEFYSLNKLGDPEEFQIQFESKPEARPEELSKLEKVDSEDMVPLPLRGPKTTTNPKENLFRSKAYRNQHKHLKPYKNLK